jgi:hypothetical protein
VDAFVSPLSDEAKAIVVAGREPDKTSAAITMVAKMSFSVASAAAGWAVYNVLRMRSYWVSMAGSIAIMPGAYLCYFAGFPIGIWALMVLFRPEASAAFR